MAASTQAPNAWRVLALLFAANLLNFFDRTLPAVVAEPIRREWGLNDFELGLISTSFVLVYAVAGLPLGRWVDHGSRRVVLALGLAVWSLFTGLAGLASTFVAFLWLRAMVGIGEASYAPAANSLVGDLFPSARRARAVGLFMLGLPMGLLITYFAVGPIVTAFQSWRAPFYLAAIPGLLLAFACLRIREPARGAADAIAADRAPPPQPFRALMRIPTLWCLVGSGLSINFAAYAANAFLVPLFMRHFGLALTPAANLTGLICGATGLVALPLGGWIADKLHQRSERGRLRFGAYCLALAAVGTTLALTVGADSAFWFTLWFALGWLCYFAYYPCVYPALHDVVEPRLRGRAMALYFAAMYLLGGAAGPLVVGGLSDHLATQAMHAAGATVVSEAHKAAGLFDAMALVPVMLAITAAFVLLAMRSFPADARAMRGVASPQA
ncbi:MAG TPA: MFS transporter [Pseudomonadota bacterium]|nr:MFS transporter [Pseudomonadota bacterium]